MFVWDAVFYICSYDAKLKWSKQSDKTLADNLTYLMR